MNRILALYREIRFTPDYQEKTLTLTEQLSLKLVEEVLQNEPEAAQAFARYEEQAKVTRQYSSLSEQFKLAGMEKSMLTPGRIIPVTPNSITELQSEIRFKDIELQNQDELNRQLNDDLEAARDTIKSLEQAILKLSKE